MTETSKRNVRDVIKEEIPLGLPAVYGCQARGIFLAFPVDTEEDVIANFLSTFAGDGAVEGVLWTDENEFVALDDLNYNDRIGFFTVSNFPEEQRQLDPAPPLPPSSHLL